MARKKIQFYNLEPDEIFMDSKNIPGFETGQMEGRIERPISQRTFSYVGVVLFIALVVFSYQALKLQFFQGDLFKSRADRNRLKIIPLWPERGLIFDRDGEQLAENKPAFRLVLETFALDLVNNLEAGGKLLEELKDSGLLDPKLADKTFGDFTESDNIVLSTFNDWLDAEDVKNRYPSLPLAIESFSVRDYKGNESISHLLGYVGYPSDTDMSSNFGLQSLVGKTGAEENYNDALEGKVGSKLIEINSKDEIFSETVEVRSNNGADIYLTIDIGLQKRVYESIKNVADERGFKGGAAVILNAQTGEILSLVSYPGFNPDVMTQGKPRDEIKNLLNSSAKPFFNRAISGLYPPGSVFKPVIAIAALEERTISPEKEILSTGSISLPNPFDPSKPSVFYDWRAHGWVDMRRALAYSSDVYFYSIGGGFGDVKGLGVLKIKEWAKKFGLGEKTGIDLPQEKSGFIPDPEWKASADKTNPVWRIGDTYHLSIGQGSLQVTPLQMALVSAAIANGGKIMEPKILWEIKKGGKTVDNFSQTVRSNLGANLDNLKIVQEGMKLAAQIGTAQALSGLSVTIAGKTGTAEIGTTKSAVNSWFIGFFPYENPKISMAVVLESGSVSNLIGAPAASRQIVEWLLANRPNLLKD